MTDLTNVLGGPWSPPPEIVSPPEYQLVDAIRAAGLEPPEHIVMDGKIHRFNTNGKRGDDAGWYVIYPDGVPSGAFGCWRDDIHCIFRADVGRELSAAESMEVTRRQREARELRKAASEKRHVATAGAVEQIWRGGMAASSDHPYLKRKGVEPHGSRVLSDGRLVLPLYDQHGELSSLQYITTTGEKQYQAGGAVKGCTWVIGDIDSPTRVYVVEGFATGATVHQVTGKPVVVAYSAHNLPDATGIWREKLGRNVELVIVADNDASGTGLAYANQAAAKHGATVIIPPTQGDANDYAQAGEDLSALLNPPKDDWLIHADEFSCQPAPISWHIKHWVQQDALVMVHGPSGGGKTFVVLDWCMRIASGTEEWMGNKVRPSAVVYLAGEGHHGLRGRIAAWKQRHATQKTNMWLSRAGCDLNTPEGYQRVLTSIRSLPEVPGVIVVDTLHRFLSGDENSAQDAKTMLDACGELMREFGCTVILVHHTGVSDEAQHRARGSSAWRGALDIEVSIIPAKGDRPMEIIQRKSKDAELAEPLYASLATVEIEGWIDEDGEPVSSAVVEQDVAPESEDEGRGFGDYIKTFERAWWNSGCEERDGKPYVSKSAMILLLESDGIKASTARNYVKASYANGTVGKLINGELIAPFEHGWVVQSAQQASAMMLRKNGG